MAYRLEDDSEMPWGKYKYERMADIPADYFHYLWTSKKTMFKDNYDSHVADYIRRHLDRLRKLYPDGIWS